MVYLNKTLMIIAFGINWFVLAGPSGPVRLSIAALNNVTTPDSIYRMAENDSISFKVHLYDQMGVDLIPMLSDSLQGILNWHIKPFSASLVSVFSDTTGAIFSLIAKSVGDVNISCTFNDGIILKDSVKVRISQSCKKYLSIENSAAVNSNTSNFTKLKQATLSSTSDSLLAYVFVRDCYDNLITQHCNITWHYDSTLISVSKECDTCQGYIFRTKTESCTLNVYCFSNDVSIMSDSLTIFAIGNTNSVINAYKKSAKPKFLIYSDYNLLGQNLKKNKLHRSKLRGINLSFD